jgi:uncharacterized protein
MSLEQFQKQSYLNIETFRKNGQGVKTPVWFVQDGNTLHIWTQASSGKAKRIRRDGSVKIVPSTGAGQPLGEWVPAHAESNDSLEKVDLVKSLMKKKYGFIFQVFHFLGRLRKQVEYTVIEIHPS